MLPGLPFLPEIHRLLRLTIAEQVVHLDIKGVRPPGVIGEPSDGPVEKSIDFIVGAAAYTVVTTLTDSAPVQPAGYGINPPLSGTSGI